MDILHGLVVIVVAGAAVIASGLAIFVLYFLVQKIWPVMIGGLGGYLIWKNFDTDLGILFAILFCVIQFWWWRRSKRNLYSPLVDPTLVQKKKPRGEDYIYEFYDI